MRLKNYLGDLKIEDLLSILEKDCKSFKNEIGGGDVIYAYRGSHNIKNPWEIKFSRSDRKPTDMPVWLQKALDNVFAKDWGWQPRSEGVFATGDDDQASAYGEDHIFVPIGHFKYLWSTKIDDLYNELCKFNDFSYMHGDSKKFEIYFKNEPDLANSYRDDDLRKAIRSKGEIMFKCKSYLMISKELSDVYDSWWYNDLSLLRKREIA